MADIATLMMKIEADTKDFEKKMGGVGNTMKTVGKGMAVAGVAIAGATTALFGIAKNASEAGDRVDKMSQKIGISRTAFQELDYVFSQSGASIESLQMGMKTLVSAMDEAEKGTGKGADNFSKLGISAKDAEGKLKSQTDMLYETIGALQKMPEGAEKARLANELFGRSGSELMPLLNDTTTSVEELAKQARDLGLVMSDDAVDASVVFGDTMDAVKQSLGMVVTELGISVMPLFQKFLEWVMEHLPRIKEMFSTVFGVIRDVVVRVWDAFEIYVLPVLQKLFKWLETNFPIIQQTFENVFGVIKSVLELFWTIVNATVIPILEKLFGKFGEADGVSTGFEKAMGVINGVLNGAITIIQTLIGWIEKAVEWYGKLKDAMTKSEGSAGTFTGSSYTGSSKAAKIPWSITQETKSDQAAIKSISAEKNVDLTTARDMYKKSLRTKAETKLADGGVVTRPTVALIGEAGAEAVIPLEKSTGLGTNITINVRSPFDVAKEIDFIQKKLAWGI